MNEEYRYVLIKLIGLNGTVFSVYDALRHVSSFLMHNHYLAFDAEAMQSFGIHKFIFSHIGIIGCKKDAYVPGNSC